MDMKLDADFQKKFFSYLNSLSKEEIISIIDEPEVNVDFLANVISFNNIVDMYKYYSANTTYNDYFCYNIFNCNINHLINVKSKNYYNSILNSVLNKKDLTSLGSNIIEEYTNAANDNRYAIAA